MLKAICIMNGNGGIKLHECLVLLLIAKEC
jgi:hypothetical protein